MQGYTVNIIKPDGTTETLGPVNSYMGDGTYWWDYAVDQVGTWSFQFVSPGTYLPAGNYTDSPTGQGFLEAPGNQYYLGASLYYEPSTTPWYNITVQQNAVASWPPAALPSAGDYWSRPINPMNREWASIAGNYPFNGAIYYPNGNVYYTEYSIPFLGAVDTNKYTPYVQAPASAHIIWTRETAIAGLIGGSAGQYSTFSSGGTPSVIFDGRCYQTFLENYNGLAQEVLECYDLRTGQVYWDEPAPSVTEATGFGSGTETVYVAPQYITYELGSGEPVPGGIADNGYTVRLVYLGNYLIEWDPFSGAITTNISLPSYISDTLFVNDPYCLSVQTAGTPTNPVYYLINWTIAATENGGFMGEIQSTDFTTRVMSNVTWPFQGVVNGYGGADVTYDLASGIAVAGNTNPFEDGQYIIGYLIVTADMNTGAVLVNERSNDTLTFDTQNPDCLITHDGLLAMADENGHWNCWNERTGALVWTSQSTVSVWPQTSSTPDYPWGNWWAYSSASYDINESCSIIVGCSYGGLFGINWADGTILWHYFDNNTAPFESPYIGNSFFTGCETADGMVYTYAGEHTPTEPINRGWDTVCLNATTGALIWRIENTMAVGAVADGYLTAANQDDGYMYVFGMGKSATTVTAPDTAVTQGVPVVIKGSVMDMSPAQPNTPCVSDASMANQMEYLHMQQPITGLWGNTTMTGVPVVLTATDSSGNVYSIGTATTNAYDGTFGMSWTPPSAGTYHISASFYGTDSYGSSSAGNTLVVTAAAATPTPAPSVTTASNLATTTDLMTDIVIAAIAMIIAVIIAVAIATILIIRKRP
jgi:hypothetical protein